MTNPVIWLCLSIVLLALGLALLICVSIPAFLGLARATRSAEKLFDTLDRELPRTLEAMRHTGNELSGLADDMTDSVTSARNIVKQVDHSLKDVRQQAYQAKRTTHGVAVGFRAAWRVLTKPTKTRSKRPRSHPVKPPVKPSPPIAQKPAPQAPTPPGPNHIATNTTPTTSDRSSDHSSDRSSDRSSDAPSPSTINDG